MADAHGMMHLNHMNTRQDTHAAKVYHQSTAEPRNVSIILQPKASHLQIANYSLRPKINVVLACNEIHLIKAIPNTKKTLYRKMYRANQILRSISVGVL